MRFFICKDKSKFTKDWNVEKFGDWYFMREDDVELFEGKDYIILWCGYLIEGDMRNVLKNFSFRNANGNFFAIKLTKTDYQIELDYFQNHKLFVGDKYGIEITNYMPYMTIKKEDIVRKHVVPDEHEREHTPAEKTTYYDRIFIYDPKYDYIGDAKKAFAQNFWHDQNELTEHIHKCMKQHSEVIKAKYPKRMSALSEGIDSCLQGQFFREDKQLLYILNPCDSGENHKKYIEYTASQFPDTHILTFEAKDNRQHCIDNLIDSSCRWQSMMPTLKQVKMQDEKPDMLMYGGNGNEMFCRDLIPHMLYLCLKYYEKDTEKMKENLLKDISGKHNLYGSMYSMPAEELGGGADANMVLTHHGFSALVNKFMGNMFGNEANRMHYLQKKSYEEFEYVLMNLTTPKLYTRVIAGNLNIMSSSLYSDRRIFYEFLKSEDRWLSGNAMDAPIQRALLDKYNYKFITPRNDIVGAPYEELYSTSYEATIDHDLEQNL